MLCQPRWKKFPLLSKTWGHQALNPPLDDEAALIRISLYCGREIFAVSEHEGGPPDYSQSPKFLMYFSGGFGDGILFKQGKDFFWRFCCIHGDTFESTEWLCKDMGCAHRIDNPTTLQDIIRNVEENGSVGELTKVQQWSTRQS